jgi:hypothetical protein
MLLNDYVDKTDMLWEIHCNSAYESCFETITTFLN